jgi:hypothetical protein
MVVVVDIVSVTAVANEETSMMEIAKVQLFSEKSQGEERTG